MRGHGLDLSDLGLGKIMASCEQCNKHLDSIQDREFLDTREPITCRWSRMTLLNGVGFNQK